MNLPGCIAQWLQPKDMAWQTFQSEVSNSSIIPLLVGPPHSFPDL